MVRRAGWVISSEVPLRPLRAAMSDPDLTELARALNDALDQIQRSYVPSEPGTRCARIDALYRLLRELPEGPDRAAEATRLAGLTDLDVRFILNEARDDDRRTDAMMEWHEEEQSAWRRAIIACLERWDELTPENRKVLAGRLRDLFQRLAEDMPATPK
jgi:hypothetical protein